ncbi:VIT1/CCC1 transporter family protein [Ekhidna sp.]
MKQIQQYLTEVVYGSIDGSISTFAVVAGAAGANLNSSIVIILGVANLIADGFSMSIGSYLSSKSEKLQYEKFKQQEYWEIENLRESEVQEVRDIFQEKGFKGTLLESVVSKITENRDEWVDIMMKHELNMIKEQRNSVAIGLATFISFLIAGAVPLLIYIYDFFLPGQVNLFFYSSLLTGVSFIAIGLLKGIVTQSNKLRRIVETLSLGTIAATLAYFTGELLDQWIG